MFRCGKICYNEAEDSQGLMPPNREKGREYFRLSRRFLVNSRFNSPRLESAHQTLLELEEKWKAESKSVHPTIIEQATPVQQNDNPEAKLKEIEVFRNSDDSLTV